MSEPGSGALEGLRILEVAGLCSAYAGRLFAGMGADVILVEPPAGAAHRRQGPFIDNVPSIERSLTFTYLHAGKRSVTLDLDTADGQALFRKLAATASVVVESEPVGVMRARGLDYASLKEINPALVYTSITPFGSDGPYKEYVANDLILLAMGGLLTLGGYAEAEPTRAPGDQALLAGGQFGAIGTMMAVLDAEESGAGQFVDVSVQECVTTALETAIQFYDLEGIVRRRGGSRLENAPGSGLYPCKDGEIVLSAGASSARWLVLMEWLESEGLTRAEELSEERWKDRDWVASKEATEIFKEIFIPFAMAHTKRELYEGGKQRGIPLVPINTPADIPASEQFRFRGFLETLPHHTLDRELVMPGAPFQLSDSPWRMRRPAPPLGGHNLEVLGELGLTPEDLQRLSSGGVL